MYSVSITQVLSGLAALALVRVVCSVTFRLLFHPLAAFPGPKASAATTLWEFLIDSFLDGGGKYMYQLDKWHDIYGPIVRVGPNEVHIRDPFWTKTLYAGPGHIRDKDPSVALVAGTKDGTFGALEHELHRARRSAIKPLFSRKHVLRIEPLIWEKAESLYKSISNQLDQRDVADLRVHFLALSADVITSLLCEECLGLLSDYNKAKKWFDDFSHFDELFPLLKQCPSLIPLGLKLPLRIAHWIVPKLAPIVSQHRVIEREARMAFSKATWGHSASEKKSLDADDTIYSAILNSSLPKSEKQPHRLVSEAFEILGAGSLTTMKVASAAAYHILANEAFLRLLQRELRNAIPDPAKMTSLSTLEQLPLLTAALKEALRLACLITSRLPLIARQEELRYKNWVIPRGTAVSMTFSSVGMDPLVVQDPYTFRPERWLNEGPEKDLLSSHCLPFGRGSRMCLGVELAWAELYITIATIVCRMDLTLHDTVRARDIDHSWGGFLGQPSLRTQGIRVKRLG